MRRVVPYAVLPLALIACGLASAPWLRAFPSDVISVPLFGAAVLSVLVPLIVVGIGVRRLQLTALIDVILFVFYELLVTVRDPTGFDSLWTGLVHGPSEILTFALPLVSPRTLLVAPVALCWLAGAILGECVARGWQSVVPYAVLLTTFGLSYAGSARGISSSGDGRRYDTLLAGGLLLAMLLMRAAQAWIDQDRSAESSQADGTLPLRGLFIGGVVSIVVALAAAGAVQSSAFTGQPVTPARVPALKQTQPLTPVSFISGLRPRNPHAAGKQLFSATFDRATSPYISIASVDTYDGSGWSFDRTFRPSGGVVPPETDPTLRPPTKPVIQRYSIDAGPMTSVPWMPYLHRPARVSGTRVNIDAASGMIVPAAGLTAGRSYTVRSDTSRTRFSDLPGNAAPSLSGDGTDIQLPGAVSNQLTTLITTLQSETGVSSADPVAFLQAVAREFRTQDALSGGPATEGPSQSDASGRPSTSNAPSTPSTGASPSGSTKVGGNGFADVLASIRQNRSATPEQFATLTALIARTLHVRARLVTGFRVTPPNGSATLPRGTYKVDTREAWTWVEVPITNVGWVVLDPSPGDYSDRGENAAAAQPSASASPTPTRSVQISRANNSEGNGGAGVLPNSKVPTSTHLSTLTIVTIIVLVVVVGLVALLLFLLLRKRVRARRRRRTDDPRLRLIGAWQETLDFLMEAGMPDLDSLTGTEVSAATASRFGSETGAQAQYLGDAASAAIFGPTSRVGQESADSAWRAHRTLRQSVRRCLPWRTRAGASLRYHRSRRARPLAGPTSWAATATDKATGRSGRSGRGRHSGGGHRRTRAPRAH